MIPIVAGLESISSSCGGSDASFVSSSCDSFRSSSPRSLTILRRVARDLGNVRIGMIEATMHSEAHQAPGANGIRGNLGSSTNMDDLLT